MARPSWPRGWAADLASALTGAICPLHPRNDTFPGEVFLHLAADALEWCGASRAEPLHLEGPRERFLPEATFRGRRNTKFQYPVLAVAGVHGGTEPDLLEEVASWQADDFWQYAMYAAVAYIPRRRRPGECPSAPSMPGPRRAPWPPGDIAMLLCVSRCSCSIWLSLFVGILEWPGLWTRQGRAARMRASSYEVTPSQVTWEGRGRPANR